MDAFKLGLRVVGNFLGSPHLFQEASLWGWQQLIFTFQLLLVHDPGLSTNRPAFNAIKSSPVQSLYAQKFPFSTLLLLSQQLEVSVLQNLSMIPTKDDIHILSRGHGVCKPSPSGLASEQCFHLEPMIWHHTSALVTTSTETFKFARQTLVKVTILASQPHRHNLWFIMPDTTETHGSHLTVPVDTCPSPGCPCWEILNSPYVLNFNKKQPPCAMGISSPSPEIQEENDLVKRRRKTPSRLYSDCCQSPSPGLTQLLLANPCLQCC